MKTLLPVVGFYLWLSLAGSSAFASGWSVEKKVDPLTDEIVAIAYFSNQVFVRCTESNLEVYFDFNQFLDDDRIPVRYRVDKEPLIEEKWSPSATG